jgi:crotonobetainyl-CoA:carnitine CoA-transferase CaiB-like acyl-CoA transferase
MPAQPGPLASVLVVDLSRVLAGPWCTQVLADLGADVIKIERPGTGDDTRDWGPPFLTGPGGERGDSAYYLACNRNKRSVALDLSKPLGQRAVRELAAMAQVLVENHKVDGLARYGLDYQSLSSINPSLIYCSITGFGQTGPYRHRPGYDFIIQGLGGLMSVTGERDDVPGGGPQKVGVAVSDLMTGMNAAIAILAALLHRRETGKGQHIDAALLDTQVAMIANLNMNYLVSGRVPGRMGNAHQNIVPYQSFKTSNGHIILTVGNDSQFANFCRVAGRPELAKDPRFMRNSDRVANRPVIVPILEELIAARPSAWWLTELEAAGVPAGPINGLDQVFQDPQVIARGLQIAMAHPLRQDLPLVASPLRLSETPVSYHRAPPLLGADTAEVLRSLLGWSATNIEALEAESTGSGAP